ncbi:MAG: M20 family metallopeptidase [Firmicutes bacterium]|nr:M20 family metallopeptidase [Bacillota bacterium]
MSGRPRVNPEQVVALTQELVRIPSHNPPGGEERCARYLSWWLEDHGISSQVIPVAPDRANVLARIPGEGRRPGVLLCGHLDTVPISDEMWLCDPFSGEVRDGRLYGLGASDMKGGIAAMACAMAAIMALGESLAGDLVMALTADEEDTCLGAREIVSRGLLPTGLGSLVIAEPTGLQVASCHKGALWLELEVRGKASHAAMPDLGVNAVSHMAQLIGAVERYRLPCPHHRLLGSATLAVTTVKGGLKVNIIPDFCRATVDVRTVPGCLHSDLLVGLERLLDEFKSHASEVEVGTLVLKDYPAVDTSVDALLISAALDAVRIARPGAESNFIPEPCGMPYYTDASILAPATGLPVVLCGPGEPEQAHHAGEWVDTVKLAQATSFYVQLVRSLLL